MHIPVRNFLLYIYDKISIFKSTINQLYQDNNTVKEAISSRG